MLSSKLTQRQIVMTLAVSALLAGTPGRVGAHRVHAPRKNNRYVLVAIQARRVVLAYSILYGRLPSVIVREAVDRDRNGSLSAREVDEFLKKESRRVAGGIRLMLDGRPRKVTFSDGAVNLVGRTRTGPYPLTVELVARWKVGPGQHRLRFEDKTRLKLPGETHVVVEPRPEVRLLESHAGKWSAGLKTRYTFEGDPSAVEDRSITVVFRHAAGDSGDRAGAGSKSAPSRRPGQVVPYLVAAGAVLLLALAYLWLRMRRGRRTRDAGSAASTPGPSRGS